MKGVLVVMLAVAGLGVHARDVTIVRKGQARAAIFAPARVMAESTEKLKKGAVWRTLEPEANRRRLKESVTDLAAVLERMSGAKIDIVVGKPAANDRRLPILIGELAAERFGKPEKSFPYQQGLRIVVSRRAIGLSGESDLAASYAIYTLLDQLGCRWYMPSAMGEALPKQATIALPVQDISTGPSTIYRGIWYCDDDYARRNRMGGMCLAAGHALERTVPKELRESHPEIRAIVRGKPHPSRVKWTHPLVAQALADAALAALDKDPNLKSISLSPSDGMGWDESDDAKYDAGDFDPAVQTISKTDRLMVVASRVAAKVTAKHAEVKFGILAYADYTRPPMREKVHPNVVPEIAPITFSRAQPMTDTGEPNNETLRYLVDGWGKAAAETSYYFYGFYLAEVSSPNPMITKWGIDIPYIYKHGNCRYWQPETMANFETSMHALYMGVRMAWDTTQDPKAIIDELHQKFYGAAAKEMAEYWHFIDDVWVNTPEYAGCGFGHLRRWTAPRLAQARQIIDRAAAACQTNNEKARVRLASLSLEQFEAFMKLRRDLAGGRFKGLAAEAGRYRQRVMELGAAYQPQFAFTRMGWTRERTVSVRYFDAFFKKTYEDATRIATDYQVLTQPPLNQWRYRQDKEKEGEAAGWTKPAYDDSAWKTTNACIDTWSALGFHNYMGSMWYRSTVELPPTPAGKKTFLWIGATDGRVKLFVNGRHVSYVDAEGKKADSFSGYCKPASFDITTAISGTGKTQISLFCTREFINELGTGGLIAPVVVYREN